MAELLGLGSCKSGAFQESCRFITFLFLCPSLTPPRGTFSWGNGAFLPFIWLPCHRQTLFPSPSLSLLLFLFLFLLASDKHTHTHTLAMTHVFAGSPNCFCPNQLSQDKDTTQIYIREKHFPLSTAAALGCCVILPWSALSPFSFFLKCVCPFVR